MMQSNIDKLVAKIEQFCKDNYEKGYDGCVECWEKEDYENWIKQFNVVSVTGFKQSYQFMIDHKEEIEATAF